MSGEAVAGVSGCVGRREQLFRKTQDGVGDACPLGANGGFDEFGQCLGASGGNDSEEYVGQVRCEQRLGGVVE